MRVRVLLSAACVVALTVLLASCNLFTGTSSSSETSKGHDSEADATLDSNCKTLTVTDHAHGNRNKFMTWKIRSNCESANQAHASLTITFAPEPGKTLPVANCPCSVDLNDGGAADLREQIDAKATLSFPFKYTVTLYGVTVDPILEIDP